ncbi:MAG TPA: bifunctional DNA-binding transcriptional regulator/O6-methylguanine-DNA methyltransferase Ada [Burkholderiales bacterium]|nr:bifunctional DNA-binding transcriptional regulator/O6-methylguanine-DNA methyltransferase Ada [Burkholderiales bacterium]
MNAPITTAQLAARTLDDPRWQAVLARDAEADGRFYYAVRTTGVYCRPSCSARRARPENVSFHLSCAAAEKAGFRPCKRCHPHADSVQQKNAALIARACRIIERAETAPKLDTLATQLGLSPYHFHRQFKQSTGLTPKAYALKQREQRLRSALVRSRTVTEAIFDAGYNSQGRFYDKAKAVLGMKARDYRAGGLNAQIRFAVAQCSLGAILVAQSDKGICAIALGDDPNALVRELQDRFPKAAFVGADRKFEKLVAQVIGFVEEPKLGLNLPLDLRGTAFQQRVWQALQKIPAGKTLSYTEIAKRIGLPTAVRAVASACAANTIAVAIPCHRVVRTDGSLSGYRWGVERKRSLIDREGS